MICPNRAVLPVRNTIAFSLFGSVGGLLPFVVFMGFLLLKFSRQEPPAFLLNAII
jgi:hypothetical protein